MNLLVVAYKFGTEDEIGRHLGTYSYFLEMLKILARQGNRVSVIAPWISPWRKGSLAVDGVEIIRYYAPLISSNIFFPLNKAARSFYIWRTGRLVQKYDLGQNFDAILVWQARETGYAVARVSPRLRAPFLFRQITAWRWHFERRAKEIYGGRKAYRFFEKLRLNFLIDSLLEMIRAKGRQIRFAKEIYNHATRLLFASRAAFQEELPLGIDEKKVSIWPVGIDIVLFSSKGNRVQWRKKLQIKGDRVLLFIGRINFAEKGIGYLLEAMPAIIQTIPGVNLVIIGGGGESERLVAMIKNLEIGPYVQLVGQKPFPELADYLNASDLLVVPSVWVEHFGQVTIEAMACGVPVVTTDRGGSPEINVDGQTGFVVPAANASKLAEAVIKLLRDGGLRDQMGQAARKRVEENYSYDRLAEKLTKLIEEIKKHG